MSAASPARPPVPPPRRPPGRYGDRDRPLRRRALVAALAAAAAGLLALLGWSAWHHATDDVRTGLLAFTVVDDARVEVRFEVLADAGAGLECDLRALDFDRVTVGSATVQVPPGPQARREAVATVRTRQRAVTGEVQACRVRS